jgi:hypothetical protein
VIAQLQELYTTDEVATAKKVSADYIRKLVKDGKVTPFRTSGARNAPMRFGPQHLEQIDAAMTPTPPAESLPRRRRRRRP